MCICEASAEKILGFEISSNIVPFCVNIMHMDLNLSLYVFSMVKYIEYNDYVTRSNYTNIP